MSTKVVALLLAGRQAVDLTLVSFTNIIEKNDLCLYKEIEII
jgi:hypothetical protein